MIVDSHVVQAGRTLALIRGEIKSPDGRVVYVTCDHQKINVGPSPDMMAHEPEPRCGLRPSLARGGAGRRLDSKL